jgi:hypothetical protein
MPGCQARLHAALRRLPNSFHRRRHHNVRKQDEKVFDAFSLGPPDRHRVRRRRGLEPNRKEYNLTLRIRPRKRHRIER